MIFSVSHRRFSLRNGHRRHSRERITSGTPFGIFGAFCSENADGPGGGGRRGTNANHGAAARQTRTNRCRDRPSRPTGGNTRGRQPGTETAGRRAVPRDASTARPQGPAARYRQNIILQHNLNLLTQPIMDRRTFLLRSAMLATGTLVAALSPHPGRGRSQSRRNRLAEFRFRSLQTFQEFRVQIPPLRTLVVERR